jgi:hypothetical protein
MINLVHELAAAARLARDERVAAAVDAFVEIDNGIYRPNDIGQPAFVAAAELQGELIDLVACRLRDRLASISMGIAAALGEDATDITRWKFLSRLRMRPRDMAIPRVSP